MDSELCCQLSRYNLAAEFDITYNFVLRKKTVAHNLILRTVFIYWPRILRSVFHIVSIYW